MKTYYFIRHTSPDISLDKCYGQMDVAVDPRVFDAQQERLKNILREYAVKPDAAIYSSPISRCRLLAESLAAGAGITFDDRLKELDFGEWEGIPWKDIDSAKLETWMEAFPEQAAPGGESFRALQERMLAFWTELTAGPENEVLVVSHGGTIRSLLSHILEMPLSKMFTLHIDFGSISAITTQNNKHKLYFLNR